MVQLYDHEVPVVAPASAGLRMADAGVLKQTRRGRRPYICINFGFWKGNIVKINIWSEGFAKLSKRPDESWIGKWVSVTGLVDPPYSNPRFGYTHLSITITESNQLRIIDAGEAARRLGANSPQGRDRSFLEHGHS